MERRAPPQRVGRLDTSHREHAHIQRLRHRIRPGLRRPRAHVVRHLRIVDLDAVDPHDVRVGRHMDIGIHAPIVAVWYLNWISVRTCDHSSHRSLFAGNRKPGYRIRDICLI